MRVATRANKRLERTAENAAAQPQTVMRLIVSLARRLLITTLLVLASSYSTASTQRCLKYWPAAVSLTGTLRSQVFPGPPNFESTKRGDRKERAIILTLVVRTCTTGNNPQGFEGPETNIREMQLVVTKSAHWKTVERRIGKRVVVTGTLFHAFTGHHRTKVLIDVTDIRAAA
jgi:hypothetical protein